MADINEIFSKEAIQQLDLVEKGLLANLEAAQKLNTEFTNIGKTTTNYKEKTDKLTAAQKEQERISKQNEQTVAKLTSVLSNENRELEANRQKLNQANRETRLSVTANEALVGSYKKIQAEMSKNMDKLRSMQVLTKQDEKARRALAQTINKQNNELKRLDAQMGIHNRNVGNYTKSILTAGRSLVGAFGVVTGVALFAKVLKDSFNVMKEFGKQMQFVRGITRATDEEFIRLEADAKRLGASTEYTAKQVAELQTEYGRLGFTTEEILRVTGATLDLATATGEDLAKSAEIAGATLRGFGLDASETQRVVDVMADSFNKSALNLDRWGESMKYVAPIARVAGVSIEEAAAMMSILADAGIHGSMAGTALRKMMLELTGTGEPLSVRLKELADKGLTLADANDEVGERAQTALLVLSKQVDKLPELTTAYENATGAGKKMADMMRDTVAGDIAILKSAWDGFILSVDEGRGVISTFIRGVLRGLTNMFASWSGANKEQEQGLHNLEIYTHYLDLINGKYAHLATSRENEITLISQLRGELNLSVEDEKYLIGVRNSFYDELPGKIDDYLNKTKQKTEDEIAIEKEKNAKLEAEYKAYLERIKAARVANEIDIAGAIAEAKKSSKQLDPVQQEIFGQDSITDNLLGNLELRTQATREFNEDMGELEATRTEQAQNNLDDLKENYQQLFAGIAEFGQISHDFSSALMQSEMQQLDERYQYELQLAGDNAAKKEKADKKYQDERKKLLQKQAKIDKAFAIFQATINFAQALVAALTVPPPASFVFEAITAALAGIALAAVIATPLPTYAKGTKSAKRGPAVWGEKGRELMIGPDGRLALSPSTASLVNLKGGERILTNRETELLMRTAKGADDIYSRKMMEQMHDDNREIVKAIRQQKPVKLYKQAGRVTDRPGNYYGNYYQKKIAQ